MNCRLEAKRISRLTFFACFISYTIICMSKATFSAAIAPIVEEGLLSKPNAGMINSAFYLFYAVSLFFGGYLSDRISPFKLVLVGLVGSFISNAVMAVWQSFPVLLIAQSFSGLAQFAVWPSIIKIISSVVMEKHRKKSMFYISFAYCSGMAISYLTATLVLSFLRWQYLFLVSSFFLLIATLFFMYSASRVRGNAVLIEEETSKAEPEVYEHVPVFRLLLKSGVILLLIPATIRPMLDIGLKSWIPTMIMEMYGVTPGTASMLTTILTFVNLLGVFFASWIYPKRCKSIVSAILVTFAASLPLLYVMLYTGKIPLALVVALLSIVTTLMYSGNPLFNVFLPPVFSRYGKVGTVAGIVNGCAAGGILIANYIYGVIAEHFGWSLTIICWISICACAIVFCLFASPIWRRFMRESK